MTEPLSVDTEALSHVPSMITSVRHGIASVQSLTSPAAAMGATGSIAASAAIGTLASGIAAVLAELVASLDADADGLTKSIENYTANEHETTAGARSILDILGDLLSPPEPGRREPVRHGASGSW